MTHLYETWLIHVWRDIFICIIEYGVVHIACDMTRSCVGHDSFVRDVTRSFMAQLIHMDRISPSNVVHIACDMTHASVSL